jgi:radical SAM protein with 4Fe4S-binding SPASM domain
MNRLRRALTTLVTRRLEFTFDKMEFAIDGVSRKRLFNWLAAEATSVLKTPKAWAYPTHLQIEPTTKCNLKCPLCNVVTDRNRPQGELSLDRFKRIMDEIGDYLILIQLWGWGEPFMNRDIFSMIKHAKSRGIKVITSTNGHFLEQGDNMARLLDSGLDYLIFALDGLDSKTYETYRAGGDLDRAVQGLRALVKQKEQAQVSRPYINLRMLVSRDNEHQIDRMKSFARETGVDYFSLITMSPINSDRGEWRKRLPHNPEYCRAEFNRDGEMMKKKNRCKRLWNHPFIYHNGAVYSCEYYTSREPPLGNVFESGQAGFRKIWFGGSYDRLRRDLAGGEESAKCSNCPRCYADAEQNVSHIFEPAVFSRRRFGRSSRQVIR